MPESGALIALDPGTRRTGVALGHALTGSARPLEPLIHASRQDQLDRLGKVLKRWRPGRVIIGLPLAGDGSESDMSRHARALATDIEQLWPGITIELHDERLTSQAAAGVHAERREGGRARRRDAARLDSLAAALILESWMAEHS